MTSNLDSNDITNKRGYDVKFSDLNSEVNRDQNQSALNELNFYKRVIFSESNFLNRHKYLNFESNKKLDKLGRKIKKFIYIDRYSDSSYYSDTIDYNYLESDDDFFISLEISDKKLSSKILDNFYSISSDVIFEGNKYSFIDITEDEFDFSTVNDSIKITKDRKKDKVSWLKYLFNL